MANFTYPFEWGVTNVTSFSGMLRYANHVTDNMLGIFIVMIVFFVTAISLKDYETEKAVSVAGVLSSVVCIFLFFQQVITTLMFVVMLTLTLLSSVGFYIYGRVYPQKPA